MSKENWVQPSDIEVFQPASADDLLSKKEDIALIQGDQGPDNFWEWAPQYFPSFWLFYLAGEPVGYIRRDFFKRSVELHGKVRDGFDDRGIQYYAVLASLNHTFFIVPRTKHKRGYDRVVIAVPDNNPTIKGFALQWAFEKTAHREGDVTYWRLTKDKFMRTFAKHATSQRPESESSDSD